MKSSPKLIAAIRALNQARAASRRARKAVEEVLTERGVDTLVAARGIDVTMTATHWSADPVPSDYLIEGALLEALEQEGYRLH